MSRTVVREAIQILRAEGLVRIRMGVGTFVTQSAPNILEGPMSFLQHSEGKKIQDLLTVRNLIEPPIAALAAENAGPNHIARMEQAIADMDRYMTDLGRYIERDNHFHIALAEASDNSVYLLLLNSIVDLLQESRQLAVSVPGAAKRGEQLSPPHSGSRARQGIEKGVRGDGRAHGTDGRRCVYGNVVKGLRCNRDFGKNDNSAQNQTNAGHVSPCADDHARRETGPLALLCAHGASVLGAQPRGHAARQIYGAVGGPGAVRHFDFHRANP